MWLWYLLFLLFLVVFLQYFTTQHRYSLTMNLFVGSIISGATVIGIAYWTPYAELSSVEIMSYTILLLLVFLLPVIFLGILLYTGWIGRIVKHIDRNTCKWMRRREA